MHLLSEEQKQQEEDRNDSNGKGDDYGDIEVLNEIKSKVKKAKDKMALAFEKQEKYSGFKDDNGIE